MFFLTAAQLKKLHAYLETLIHDNNDSFHGTQTAYAAIIQFFDNIILYFHGLPPEEFPEKSNNYDKLKQRINTLKNLVVDPKNYQRLLDCFQLSYQKLSSSQGYPEENDESPLRLSINALSPISHTTTAANYSPYSPSDKTLPFKVSLDELSQKLSEVFMWGIYEKLNVFYHQLLQEHQLHSPRRQTQNHRLSRERYTLSTPLNSSTRRSNCFTIKRNTSEILTSQRSKKLSSSSLRQTVMTDSVIKQVETINSAAKTKNFYSLIIESIKLIRNLEVKMNDANNIPSLKTKYAELIYHYKSVINESLNLIKTSKKNQTINNISQEKEETLKTIHDYFYDHISLQFQKLKKTPIKKSQNLIEIILKACRLNKNNKDYNNLEKNIIDYYTPDKIGTIGILNPHFILSHHDTTTNTIISTVKSKYQKQITSDLISTVNEFTQNFQNYIDIRSSIVSNFTELFKKYSLSHSEHQNIRLGDADNLKTNSKQQKFSSINDLLNYLKQLNKIALKIQNKNSRLKNIIYKNIETISQQLNKHSQHLGCLFEIEDQKRELYYEINIKKNYLMTVLMESIYHNSANSILGRIIAFFNPFSRDFIRQRRIDDLKALTSEVISCQSKQSYLNLLFEISKRYYNSLEPTELKHHYDDLYSEALLKLAYAIVNQHIILPFNHHQFSLDFTLSECKTIKELLPPADETKLSLFNIQTKLDKVIEHKSEKDIHYRHELHLHENSNLYNKKLNTTLKNNKVEFFKKTLKAKIKAKLLAKIISSTGMFQHTRSKTGYFLLGISKILEHLPLTLLSKASPVIDGAVDAQNQISQVRQNKSFVEFMNSYGGPTLFKDRVYNAIDQIAEIYKKQINEMTLNSVKDYTEFWNTCINEFFDDPHSLPQNLEIEEVIIAAGFLRKNSLITRMLPKTHYRKEGDNTPYPTTTFEGLHDHIKFKLIQNVSESASTQSPENPSNQTQQSNGIKPKPIPSRFSSVTRKNESNSTPTKFSSLENESLKTNPKSAGKKDNNKRSDIHLQSLFYNNQKKTKQKITIFSPPPSERYPEKPESKYGYSISPPLSPEFLENVIGRTTIRVK